MTASCLAYHGSPRRFTQFVTQPPHRATVAPTAQLGTFCVENPRIAAHFTLRPHVISAGYAHAHGSRVLIEDPWSLDVDPFLPDAGVAEVQVNLANPKRLSVNAWLSMMAELAQTPWQVAVLRKHWQKQGHDGLRIAAWDGSTPPIGGGIPSVETDATTWVAFDPQALTLVRWMEPLAAWDFTCE